MINSYLKFLFLVFLSVLLFTATGRGQDENSMRYSLDSENSSLAWKIKPADEVKDPSAIMDPGFNDDDWVAATVPGTVFGSYVEQGFEKDPNFGDNIYRVDKKKYNKDFWYRTPFQVPSDFNKEHIWLNLEGINRKADIYINDKYVGKTDGFYERGKFEISGLLHKDGENILAVLVHYPREPIPNYASPTYISSAGWDWMPYVPGLLSGITDDVYLSNTGSVDVVDPWIRTDSIGTNSAFLSLAVELKNNADSAVSGTLSAIINPGNIKVSKEVRIDGTRNSLIYFNAKSDSVLAIQNPALWWPNGYGDPNLYTCLVTFEQNEKVSDSKQFRFGIRKFAYDTKDNVLHISVNGRRIFLKGGDWGMSEYMLRCRGNEYDTKVRLHQKMNYNIIRNWIGSTTDEEFYQACDRYGILVWDDFWLNSHPNLPDDVFAFNKNAVEKIKRLRNHACIAVWCGDNEGYPKPPLNNWLREDVAVYDGGDRTYHPNSHSDALTGSGIWVNLEPKGYFASPPLGFGGENGWGLRTEIGTAVFTNFESFKKFMPEKDWWPRNEMWNKHFFGKSAGNAGPDTYFSSIERSYGKASGIEDFCKKAQLLNLETNKAMYEGWLDHIWDDASGIMIWMSQSAYPSFVWQTYDYYYDLNGAYWGAKSGCEPVHILWDCANNQVRVTNTSSFDLKEAKATVKVYNLNGNEVPAFRRSALIDVPSNRAETCFTIPFEDESNLAFQKTAVASSSSKDAGGPDQVTDGGVGSRWSSNYSDDQWIYVDLGKEQPVNQVQLYWENAYAKSYKIQVSDDAQSWKDVYWNDQSTGGQEIIDIDPVTARYVKMLGMKRATPWGYSLWEMKIYNKDRQKQKANPLSAVHFIRLELHDKNGKLLSENFYWRGNEYLNYQALNTLEKVDLKVKSESEEVNCKTFVTARITNPENAKNIAFAIRVLLVDKHSGEQILPVFMDKNYFSLMPGESQTVKMECDKKYLSGNGFKVLVQQYNPIKRKNRN